jgi:glycosyltransferase involved in cell wall biosynthesis
MRIAHIATTISLNQIVLNQMVYQQQKGHDVVAMGPNDEWAEGIRARGIPLIDTPFRRHDLPATGLATVKTWLTCRSQRFDVVHTHNALPGVMGRIAGGLARVPCVVHTWHSWPARLRRPPHIRVGFQALEPVATALADAVLFLNPDDMAVWSRIKGVATAKARLIGNGINVREFQGRVSPDARRRLRAELGIPDDAYVVVKVARMEHPRKGHVFFLEGVQRFVPRTRRNVVVLLVGLGDGEPAIRAAVERLGLQQIVRFTGYRQDVPDVLAAADLSVLTSPFEGVPRALMESMALGIPVLGTDVPGTRMLVRSGESGLLVRHGDVEQLAEGLRLLCEDPALAASLARQGKVRVEASFNEPEVAERVLRVYEHVLQRGREPLPKFDVLSDGSGAGGGR